jgi:outer membrane protein TolC
VAEVQTALDCRPEIKEQELAIASAKIAVGQAKNLELPQLDLTFTTTFDGLGGNADRAFDHLTQGNFIEYFIGVEFEIPIGNRAARAAHLRARLQHAQARTSLKAFFEEVIRDVHLAIRELNTAYEQIEPSYESAEAREREVESIVARAERKDMATLNQELGSRQSLAAERRAMLNAMINYNIAIIDLERAKGTLLRYNNVTIPTADSD